MSRFPIRAIEEVERLLSGEGGPAQEAELRRLVAEYRIPEDFLALLRAMHNKGARTRHPAPSGLADAVMEKISAPAPAYAWRPRVWVPVAVCVGLLVGFLVGRRAPLRGASGTVPVEFVLNAPRAQTVSLAGDFTDWAPVAMKRSDGHWRVELALPKGKYQYIFILNDRMFVVNPDAELERDTLGNYMSVVDTSGNREI